MGRALAHAADLEPRFSDPTAMELLSPAARARTERICAGNVRKRPAALFEALHLRMLARVIAARTVAIDDAIREVASPQVVILGAGLDGRAWRMDELSGATVLEVDHPDTQREKRRHAASLTPAAGDVRFVPIDFEHGDLGDVLARAGHDPARPTTWIWEGVVMYLSRADVDATLAQIARRSAAGSRLIIAYHCPAMSLHLVGALVRLIGEPLRSTFTAGDMRSLLAGHDFTVVRDQDMRTFGATLAPDVARAARHAFHLRIAVADRPW